MTTTDTRPAKQSPAPIGTPPAGQDPLGGHAGPDAHPCSAAEGQDSPQARLEPQPMGMAPAGNGTARPAIEPPPPKGASLAGHQAGQDHARSATQDPRVLAVDIPGDHCGIAAHGSCVTGDQHSPAAALRSPKGVASLAETAAGRPGAKGAPAPRVLSSLADPLLALAADVLTDLEKVRIANENRLRQLTRSEADKDGETRGFGLDESHPDVARLAALVGLLGDAEHKATLNLGRLMRQHPLGPWMASMRGVGEKQGARLLAAIGDPYIRPEIVREDGTVEPSRPRRVSELSALCGYHVIKVSPSAAMPLSTPRGPAPLTGQASPPTSDAPDSQKCSVGGDQAGHPGQRPSDSQTADAGVAPKRARGQKANWSATAKMRAFLIAESCVKQPSGSHYRDVYDAARAKYAEAVHAAECVRCGPKGKPALPGSPISAGHQHARALRAVAKEVLRDLWREAKRIHEELPVSGHTQADAQVLGAAGGDQP